MFKLNRKDGTECGQVDTSECPNIKLTNNQAIIIIDSYISIM